MPKAERLKKKKALNSNKNDVWFMLPLVFILAVIPVIVLLKPLDLKGIAAEVWTGKQSMDFFNYYKSVLFIVSGIILLILFAIRARVNGIPVEKSIYYYPLFIYVLFIIISLLGSNYKDVALFGFVERYEGSLVLLAYIVVTIVTMNLARDEKTIKLLVNAILFSALVISIIGLLQFIGWDFYKSKLGRALIVPSAYAQIREKLNFTFPKHQVYTSLYNPNYIGSYVVLILPILVGLMLYLKNIYSKIAVFLFSCAMFATLIGSGSKTGMGVAAVILVVLAVFLRKLIISNVKFISIILGLLVIIGIGANQITNGFLYQRVSSVGQSIKQLKTSRENPKKNEMKISRIEEITTRNKEMSVKTDIATLNLELTDGQIQFKDEKHNTLQIEFDKNKIINFKLSRYNDFKVDIRSDGKANSISAGGYNIPFYVTNDGFRMVGTQGRPTKSISAPKWGFEGKEAFASGRGYIWSRTIPMLKDTIIKGHGADTYTAYFPQNDYAGKLDGLGDALVVVDKPHNMYLQMGINTGVISVLAFIFLIAVYFVSCVKTYFKTEIDSFMKVIGCSIFASILGYCIAGIFNDSTVSVAPVFWAMFGMGISINEILKRVQISKDIL